MVQVSNHYLENCRRSCGDTNSTIKCDGWMDGHTDVRITKGKTICPIPLCGKGIVNILNVVCCSCNWCFMDSEEFIL